MERLTYKGTPHMTEDGMVTPIYSDYPVRRIMKRLADYEDAEEQGLLTRLDSKDKLIEVLATKLLHSEFGICYMCKNPIKNITLDGVNNGCDGNCDTSVELTVDNLLKKIVRELECKKAEQALKQMGE